MVLRSGYYEFIPSEQRNAYKGIGVKKMKIVLIHADCYINNQALQNAISCVPFIVR